MDRRFLKDAFGWGFILWLLGYALGILFFTFVPAWAIGWIIMPIGMVVTVWVLLGKVKEKKLSYYFFLGVVWMVIAIVCDYFFLVKAFHPADGYYKFDVYLYYLLTFLLPPTVGIYKLRSIKWT